MNIQDYVDRGRKAFDQIKDYNQEQIDKVVYAAAKVVFDNAELLAREAVDETALGYYEDKIAKNTDTPVAFWDYLKDKKSVGIIGEDKKTGIIEVAHPAGVIACITPATNPTVTPLGNFMDAVKGKNVIIVSPAPRAAKTTTHTVNLIRKAISAIGAPEDLIQILSEVTLENSQALMQACDLIIATGGSGMVKAAYSSGTPAFGVGPGNPPVVLDRGYDLASAVKDSIVAIGSDNGILCDGDNMMLYPKELETKLFAEFEKQGVVLFTKKADVEAFGKVLFINGKANADYVGKDAPVIAKAAGFTVPKTTKVIGLKMDVVGKANVLNKEVMGPIVVLKSYDTFEEATAMAIQNMVESGGIGHTAGIFSNDKKHIDYYAERIPVARVLVNQPTPNAWGPSTNGLTPAVSESCGTWGNNILCGNVDYIHLINVSKIAMPLDVKVPDGKKMFKD
ncbi:MAG: aldehyde dehydrogenase family protein [Acidaminococcaceae bacterium]|jgi:succinate-semialdehyde dehydrogenase|nr:aldehyde dehydrogenase family protein [Acidaminococcaceae bacterium]MCI2110140.1 aldehyde dehydrogenase family protein [Acidaminococcaceae bacterium]